MSHLLKLKAEFRAGLHNVPLAAKIELEREAKAKDAAKKAKRMEKFKNEM